MGNVGQRCLPLRGSPRKGHISVRAKREHLLSVLWLMNPGFRERFEEFIKDGK